MMMQSILVGMDWGETVNAVQGMTAELAVALDASVKAVYIEDVDLIRATTLPPIPTLPAEGTIPFSGVGVKELEQRFQAEEETLGRLFLRLVADTRIRGSFLIERGEVASILIRESRAHDLLLMGKYSEPSEESGHGHPPGAHVERVVRKVYCPVVLVPPGAGLGSKFLVAYDGSAGAHQAMATAIRLARATAAELSILSVADPGTGDRLLEEAEAYLESHRTSARLVRREGSPAETILDEVTHWGADLLAMGAYGQSRLRTFFGASATPAVLKGLACAALLCGPREEE